MTGQPVTRQGLDWLLGQYRDLEVHEVRNNGPWTIVDFYARGNQPPKSIEAPVLFMTKFAIWNHTGNVYEVDKDGAVGDDPIFEVTPLG